MRAKTYTRKDGTEGQEYSLEEGDEVVSNYDKVREFIGNGLQKGKPVVIKKYSLEVEHPEKGKIYLKITEGQKKTLDKIENLKGKKIIARKYVNKYGDQIGVTVK